MQKLSGSFLYGLFTCRLIRSVLNSAEPPLMPENMDLDYLYASHESQSVTSKVFAAIKNLNIPGQQLSIYETYYKKNILREARFDIAGREFFIAFEKAQIPHIILKGTVLKNLYPNP